MGAILSFAAPLIDKLLSFIPDPAQKAAAQLALVQAQQAGEFKELDTVVALAQGQTSTNAVEAASPSLLVAGWRPFVGWICAAALGYDFLTQPLLSWASAAFWHCPVPPQLDSATLTALITGMLGLGAWHIGDNITLGK